VLVGEPLSASFGGASEKEIRPTRDNVASPFDWKTAVDNSAVSDRCAGESFCALAVCHGLSGSTLSVITVGLSPAERSISADASVGGSGEAEPGSESTSFSHAVARNSEGIQKAMPRRIIAPKTARFAHLSLSSAGQRFDGRLMGTGCTSQLGLPFNAATPAIRLKSKSYFGTGTRGSFVKSSNFSLSQGKEPNKVTVPSVGSRATAAPGTADKKKKARQGPLKAPSFPCRAMPWLSWPRVSRSPKT
jgi:hypothetical protein